MTKNERWFFEIDAVIQDLKAGKSDETIIEALQRIKHQIGCDNKKRKAALG